MRDRLYRVEAIVLKRSDYGEADRLLTLFTPDLGKLRAIAKGARKPSSRKSGHVELFTHSALLIARGRHLDVVTQADTLDAFLPLRENLDRLGFAYYLAELVDQFVEEGDALSRGEYHTRSESSAPRDDGTVENQPLFDLLFHALKWLGDAATDPALLARFFELHLLQHVGYRPQLFQCVNCGTPLEPVQNFFSAEAGGALDPKCIETQREHIAGHGRDVMPISLEALKVLRHLQTREWEAMRSLRLNAETHSEVEALMQRYIAQYLERNLKSVEFLRTLKQPVGVVAAERQS
ncbi:MAG TPA: DNA repair protein RecO [Anaerolineae bacterium]